MLTVFKPCSFIYQVVCQNSYGADIVDKIENLVDILRSKILEKWINSSRLHG